MGYITNDKNNVNKQKEQQIEMMRGYALRTYFTNKAKQRLTNIKLVDVQKYNKIIDISIAMAKNDDLKSEITDEELKALLRKISKKRNTNIRRM